MKSFLAARKEDMLVRGEYETLKAHRRAIMKEAVDMCKQVITCRLVWSLERHALRHCFAAEREENMRLGA